MNFNNDEKVLEEAYLSISRKTPRLSSDEEPITTNANSEVSVGPMDEPAPGSGMEAINSEVEDTAPEEMDTTGVAVSLGSEESLEDSGCDEAHEMALDNLNSIRESIIKIATRCASGDSLETWAHQKLAIAMDNLADIARSLR